MVGAGAQGGRGAALSSGAEGAVCQAVVRAIAGPDHGHVPASLGPRVKGLHSHSPACSRLDC